MVSVIIPVYNVEDYIDRCMESVVNQTYKDLEILVMEAKSTDSSLFRLLEWSKKDDRITIVSRKDGGLGPGRNFGVSIAKGEYLLFVDSDDWISLDFIEKTLAIMEQDARVDIVQGEIAFCTQGVQKNKNMLWGREYETLNQKKQLFFYGSCASWGKLYRASLFKENTILQPALPCEDLAVYPSLVALARKIVFCNEAVAYYEEGREGSLCRDLQYYKKFPAVYHWGKNMLRKQKMHDTYDRVFEALMYRHLMSSIYHCLGEEGGRRLEIIAPEVYEFKKNTFDSLKNRTYWVLGGFSLRWISHRLREGKEGLTKHFLFTSIIAQTTAGVCQPFVYENEFRKACVQSDVQGEWSSLTKTRVEKYPDLLLIDFLQECENILELEDGNYITQTIAFQESGCPMGAVRRVLSWNSDEFLALWKRKCDQFIQTLNKSLLETKVILVKNKYATKYREQDQLLSYTTVQIAEKNAVLDRMYQYFTEQYNRAYVIETEENLCFTDVKEQGYETSPEYYNGDYYTDIAAKIEVYYFDSDECKE